MVDLLCDQYHYEFANPTRHRTAMPGGSHLKDCTARGLFRAASIAKLKSVHDLMSGEVRE
jgi:hypothetical protein